jgi:hypothetical protein
MAVTMAGGRGRGDDSWEPPVFKKDCRVAERIRGLWRLAAALPKLLKWWK